VRYVSLFLLGMLLTGCSFAPVSPPQDNQAVWDARQALLTRLSAWTLTGRVAVITESEGWHGDLLWKQQARNYDIRIMAPLGQGTVSLQSRDGLVTLRSTRDPRPVMAPNAEALLHRQLGWTVPVEGLRYWVLGIPDPGHQYHMNLDSDGRLVRLDQSGWEVRYLRYQQVDGYDLPGKIFLDNRDLKVRLVVERWKLEG
jgi:outer membrane lipoprotein LolB